MIVNRNSWHFELSNMVNQQAESSHMTVCQYVRGVISAMLLMTIGISLLLVIAVIVLSAFVVSAHDLAMYSYAIVMHAFDRGPFLTLYTPLVDYIWMPTNGMLIVFAALIWLVDVINKKIFKKQPAGGEAKQKNIFQQWMSDIHARMCTVVSYEDVEAPVKDKPIFTKVRGLSFTVRALLVGAILCGGVVYFCLHSPVVAIVAAVVGAVVFAYIADRKGS